jgi:hypothetical protein
MIELPIFLFILFLIIAYAWGAIVQHLIEKKKINKKKDYLNINFKTNE